MNNNFGISDKTFTMLINTLKLFKKDIDEVIIFGSRALKNFKKGSDIDIAIKGKNLDFNQILKIRTILNQKILSPYKFDVVHYDNIKSMEFKKQIDLYGKKIKLG